MISTTSLLNFLDTFSTIECAEGCTACTESTTCDSCASIEGTDHPSVFDSTLQKCVSECSGNQCQKCPDAASRSNGKCLCHNGYNFAQSANACIRDQQACSSDILSLHTATIEVEYSIGADERSYQPMINHSVEDCPMTCSMSQPA